MKTVNLSLSKQLKEAGYPQFGGYFACAEVASKRLDGNGWDWNYEIVKNNFQAEPEFIASPTADEILDQLPNDLYENKEDKWFRLTIHKITDSEDHYDGWEILYKETNGNLVFLRQQEEYLADALAEMWLYLKKENLI